MGGEDRYPNAKKTTQSRIVNGVYNKLNSPDSNKSVAVGCINNNIDAFDAFINDDSNEWLENNKENAPGSSRSSRLNCPYYFLLQPRRKLLKICDDHHEHHHLENA